ncbi:uncharacterized protein MEPE_01438 [Melanopsichium pennsylvanicum]|uniref:Transmembrane protein n=1 Tax=Melanopsichium pennsylvanicum TaxID=63383 RepID=A0AAJ4XI14_9BASI|nr:uncharacterized protein MEPE_01438 [Melanopsichium pennsylvanicum]
MQAKRFASLWIVAAAAVAMRHPAAGRSMLHTTMRIASARALSTSTARATPAPRLSSPRSLLCLAYHGQRLSSVRNVSSSASSHSGNTKESIRVSEKAMGTQGQVIASYQGPLAKTFTRLKLFSLTSLGLASVLTPVLLLAPGEISLVGRIGLCMTALVTSGVSTALIAWIGTPYVGSMRLLKTSASFIPFYGDQQVEENHNQLSSSSSSSSLQRDAVIMEINTISWRLQSRKTLIYQPTFLRPTSRPFAAWEITNSPPPLTLDPSTARIDQEFVIRKVVAETFDVKSGSKLGSWIVKYNTNTFTNSNHDLHGDVDGSYKLQGNMETIGKPIRYFNVHEELLGQDWHVL